MFEDLDLTIAAVTPSTLRSDMLTYTCPSVRVCLVTNSNCCTKQ